MDIFKGRHFTDDAKEGVQRNPILHIVIFLGIMLLLTFVQQLAAVILDPVCGNRCGRG